MKKMKRNRAGQYIPVEYANEIIETLKSKREFGDEFMAGATFALSYLTCPEGEGMHGATIEEFAENAVRVMEVIRCVSPETVMAIKDIVDDLKANSITVRSARIVGVSR